MRRAFITVMVVLSFIAIPEAAHADVARAWFSAQQYPAPVGSLVPVIATFEGDTINLGARMPVVIIPIEFAAQQSSSCRAQRKFISNTSQVEFTDCYLTQSPFDANSMAVTPVLPSVGQYESYLVEMTIMLLVTDAAMPGLRYNVIIPDTLARYPQYLPSTSASINVLPRENMHGSGGGESEPRNQRSPKGAETDPHATPGDLATHLSILESQGKWDALYDEMHPDAQAIIPRSAVVGWYANEYGPLGPGYITVTNVAYVSWTWEVTGKTYPETAEISFTQPFANGDVVTDVVRLVWTGERWSWFFGRNMDFVQEQIAKYGS